MLYKSKKTGLPTIKGGTRVGPEVKAPDAVQKASIKPMLTKLKNKFKF